MKKILCLILALSLMFALVSCAAPDDEEGEDAEVYWDWEAEPAAPKRGITLNIFNWGEYIDDTDAKVNAAFTHLTGIDVNYSVYSDNESMYAILSSGAVNYDVIFPSDYMVGKLIQNDMLAELDFNKIPNYEYIDDAQKNMSYDPKNIYSVPYTWGIVGIFYNTKYVDEEDLEDGWGLLWNEKYKDRIFMFDNPRDAFGISLKRLGYSMNSLDEGEWQEAYEELVKQKPLLQQYVMDQVYDKMINEEGWIAPYYSGDGIIMMDEEEGNTDIDFFVPEEGTNRFIDAMCIPKNAANIDAAHEYINFLCDTNAALANAEYIGYSTPQVEALAELDPEIAENPNFYPPAEVLEKTEVFDTLPQKYATLQDKLWIKLKQK